eukprot:jgi/Picre1/29772/NNA_005154.t1
MGHFTPLFVVACACLLVTLSSAADISCESSSDCPDFSPICLADESSSTGGTCVECTDSLDCRGDLMCDFSEKICKKGAEMVNAKCGPEFDNVRTYEIDVPLHAAAEKNGVISFELSKWPLYVSSIELEVSDEAMGRMDGFTGDAYLSTSDLLGLGESNSTIIPNLSPFPGGLAADGGKYILNASQSQVPQIGRFVTIGLQQQQQSQEGVVSLKDITGVKACVRRADYDFQGNPLNPVSGEREYNKILSRNGRQLRDSVNKRFCEGYSYADSPMPEGQECVGTYIGGNGGDREQQWNSCIKSTKDGKCQVGDIQLEETGFTCSPLPFVNVDFPKCGICQAPQAPACDTQATSATVDVIEANYPSAASEMRPSGAKVSSQTTVKNEGDNEQSPSLTMTFTSTSTTTVTITDARAKNLETSLSMKIPIPVISPDGSVKAGQTQTFTNAEAKASTSTVTVTSTQPVKIPPKTSQTVIGELNTQFVRLTIPVTVKVQYTCGKEDESFDTTVEMTSDGLLLQGTTSFDISYGPQTPLP